MHLPCRPASPYITVVREGSVRLNLPELTPNCPSERKENLVFSETNDKAWIIDFDLAGKVGSLYPSNYNHCNIEERHTNAKAYSKRERVHDTHALCKILQKFFPRSYTFRTARARVSRNLQLLVQVK